MEQLSNHQQGQIPISIPIPIPTPIPINVSYGGHGHGHMIHHHHHEPAAAAAAAAAATPHTSTTLTHKNHLIHSSTTLAAAAPPPPPQNHIIASINGSSMLTTASLDPEENPENEEHVNHVNNAAYSGNKKAVSNSNNIKYRECLKNHAAAMGGTATDGCGEFMPSGEEGTIEALNCSACNCHRNFHRKEIDGDHGIIMSASSWDNNANNNHTRVGRKILLGHPNVHKNMSLLSPEALGFHTNHSRTAQQYHHSHHPHPHQMIMSYSNNMGMGGMMGTQQLPSESDEQDQDQVHGYGANNVGGVSRTPVQQQQQQHLVKKRFRTKFTQEQKEKMLSFAEKVGWKIQKQEESVVQSFCNEIGVKRRVLKVWMHNNKHNLAKNKSQPIPSTTA